MFYVYIIKGPRLAIHRDVKVTETGKAAAVDEDVPTRER